jgi:hypothetical protein
MRCVARVPRFFCTLGVLAIGLTSVAQAAADRKAVAQERENRVRIAVQARTARDAKASPSARADPQFVSPARRVFIERLVLTELHSLSYENSLIAAENRLIAKQNLVISTLNNATNPVRINRLDSQALSLQGSINRNLTFLEAIQPAINATLTTLQTYASVIPGIVNAIQTTVQRNDQKIAVIAARPVFTIPPATASI